MDSKDMSFVYSIGGLLVTKNCVNAKMLEGIDEFINMAPGLADSMRECLANEKMSNFIKNMKTTHSLLQTIHAKFLETTAEKIINNAQFNNIEMCRRLLEPFVTEMLSLSIEMQMAQQRAEDEPQSKQLEIDKYIAAVNNISAVVNLLDDFEYGRALDILNEMNLQNDGDAEELLREIVLLASKTPAETALRLRDKYISKIAELGGPKGSFFKKILIVDDKPDILKTVSGMLRERYDISAVTSGRQALKLLENQNPELFILDIEMPVMDGFELAKSIRAMKDFSKTPILFLTGNATREYVVNAVKSGGNDFIVKPANRETLRSKVASYLLP